MADIVRRISLQVSGSKAESDIKRVDNRMTSLGKTTDNTVGSMFALSSAAAAVISALATNKIIEYADAWTVVNNRLANSVKLNEELADVTDRVFKVAQNSRSSLAATAELYSKLEVSTKAYNVSANEVAKVTETINKALIISGATTQGAESAILQLSQGLATGVLRGEEFNSVNENGSRLVQALADSLGVQIGQMRKLAEQGELTTQVIVEGILEQSNAIENEYTKTISTFSQATLEANNNITKFIGESTAVQGVVGVAGEAVVLLSESLDSLTTAAVVFATVLGARMVPAIYAQLAAQAALIKTQLAATVTMNAYGQVIARTTVAMNVASVASRGLASAMALLGGPVGILALVVAGLVLYSSTADTAITKSEKLAEATNEATIAFQGLSSAKAADNLADIQREIDATTAKMEKLKSEARDVFDSPTVSFGTDPRSVITSMGAESEESTEAISKLEDQLISLQGKKAALENIVTPQVSATAAPSAPKGRPSVSVENEKYLTAQLESELATRTAFFERYTKEIAALQEGSIERELLTSEAAQVSKLNNLSASYQDEIKKLKDKEAKILKDTSLSAAQREEVIEQAATQEQTINRINQQKITEIVFAGEQERARILSEFAETKTAGDVRVQSEVEITQALMDEVSARQMIYDTYTKEIYNLDAGSFAQRRLLQEQDEAQKLATLQTGLSNEIAAIRQRQATALEDESLQNEQRLLINAEFDNQVILQKQLTEDEITRIEDEGANSRQTIREMEKQAAIDTAINLGQNLMSAFQGQSKKLFEIGKVAAIAGTIVNTYESATKAFSSMSSIPIVGPALGAAAAAAAVVGGMANVKRIQSTKYNSKGSAASSSYSAGGGGGAGGSASGSASASQPQTTRYVEIRGLSDEAVLTGNQVKDILNDALQNDDDIILAVNNGQSNGAREGVL